MCNSMPEGEFVYIGERNDESIRVIKCKNMVSYDEKSPCNVKK